MVTCQSSSQFQIHICLFSLGIQIYSNVFALEIFVYSTKSLSHFRGCVNSLAFAFSFLIALTSRMCGPSF